MSHLLLIFAPCILLCRTLYCNPMETVSLTPEQLVASSSLNGQIDEDKLLDLAYTLLQITPLATPDDFDWFCCQAIGDR